mgnify:CR=1 FL=1
MIIFKKEKTAKGHWSGWEQGTNIGYVVEGKMAATPAEALDIVETKPFERETKQVNEDTGEIRLTRWYGKFYDENLYVSRDIKKVTGRKGQATAVEVTYLD